MTVQSAEKPVAGIPETGWSKARRRRGEGVRTCLPALLDRSAAREGAQGQDGTIVRGED